MPSKMGADLNPHGRPKGIIDWRTKRYDLLAALEKKGFDPIEAMIEMASNKREYPPVIRHKALKDIWDKLLPSLKAIEHSLDDQTLENLARLKHEMLSLQLEYKRDY